MKDIKLYNQHISITNLGNSFTVDPMNINVINRIFKHAIKGKYFDITIAEAKSKRTIEQNRRFWGHLTHLWKHLNSIGLDWSFERTKLETLLFACSLKDDQVPSPWPYTISGGILYPDTSTSTKTVKQMMTACLAIELLGAKYDCYNFPERWMDG